MKYSKALLFAVVLAVLPALAFAANKNYGNEKKDITISNALQVGNQRLTPGDYTLRWNNTGESTDVTFLQNGKEKAKAPARFIPGTNRSNAALETSAANSTRTLVRVYVKKGVLDFSSTPVSDASAASTSTGSSSPAQ